MITLITSDDRGCEMRRMAAILAIPVVLVGAHLANAWYLDREQVGVQTFRSEDVFRLTAILPVLAAGAGLLLGWLILGSRRPGALVALAYVIVGSATVLVTPSWMFGLWVPPDWLPWSEFVSGLGLVNWAGAAIAVIGLAEGVRWVATRVRSAGEAPVPMAPAPPAGGQPAR